VAKEQGMNSKELIRHRFATHLYCLSQRYKRLATKVLLRLPDEWDSHTANWEMREGREDEIIQGGIRIDKYQGAARLLEPEEDDEESLQEWEIILVADALNRLSDQAVCGVIVHEFGHVASGIPSSYGFHHQRVSEDRANTFAKLWGFEAELATLESESRNLSTND
jgi:hypothetical protein